MHLTRQTDFALRTMIYLAIQPAQELVQIRHICEVFDISSNHLSKVVNKLANAGFINSQRGRSGGIRLGRPAQKINIGELVRLMEPSLEPINCAEPLCALMPGCRFKSVLEEASKAFIETIDQYSLADMVENDVEILKLS